VTSVSSEFDELIVVLDLGSQYTQLIARRVREWSVYSEIKPFDVPVEEIARLSPKGIILSGGPASVYDSHAPTVSPELFELGIPILGICYGLQLTAHLQGGRVAKALKGEYGLAELLIDREDEIFKGLGTRTPVWMSHGDKVLELPPGFEILAHTANSPIAAVRHRQKPLYGLQFHPEVVHTLRGKDILRNFLFEVCHCRGTWVPRSFVERSVAEIRATVGARRAIGALSGGVDSSVASVLVHRAIGDHLTCIFVDTGLLRKEEAKQVQEVFGAHFEIPLRIVDASPRFLKRLKGISDPEQKRRIIGEEFIRVFEEEARALGQAEFLVQGTLYPDVIESRSPRGPSATIKTHHNVGGLPEKMGLKLIEPLRELFKDEVREVGRVLGLPEVILKRHPFPGPGLAVRIVGEVTEERVALLREAEAILIEELHAADYYDRVWQAFAVLLPVQTVGVMGDERTYESVIALRAVTSLDGMTADWAKLPPELLGRVSNRIINEVRGINRVVYDISSKPPSTIEWE